MPQDTVPLAPPSNRQCLDLGNWLGRGRAFSLSRSNADQLIRRLDRFGAAYFHLAEIMRISPDSFRRIAPAVHDDCIEIVGELVPITPENALKIKQAVLAWQKDSQRARSPTPWSGLAWFRTRAGWKVPNAAAMGCSRQKLSVRDHNGTSGSFEHPANASGWLGRGRAAATPGEARRCHCAAHPNQHSWSIMG